LLPSLIRSSARAGTTGKKNFAPASAPSTLTRDHTDHRRRRQPTDDAPEQAEL
jgi:hypothetical protein